MVCLKELLRLVFGYSCCLVVVVVAVVAVADVVGDCGWSDPLRPERVLRQCCSCHRVLRALRSLLPDLLLDNCFLSSRRN